MPIDVRISRYCEAIARHGSFTKAARELRIAQPALSVAIKRLEEELGILLFTREARKVVASPEALLLLRRADRIFDELKLAHHELQAAAELRVGEVKIGMPPMYGQVYFPRLIAQFHAAFPAVVITAMEGSADEVQAMLESGAIDIGMLENRRIPPGWDRIEVGRDETVLCVSRAHPSPPRSAWRRRIWMGCRWWCSIRASSSAAFLISSARRPECTSASSFNRTSFQ